MFLPNIKIMKFFKKEDIVIITNSIIIKCNKAST